MDAIERDKRWENVWAYLGPYNKLYPSNNKSDPYWASDRIVEIGIKIGDHVVSSRMFIDPYYEEKAPYLVRELFDKMVVLLDERIGVLYDGNSKAPSD